MITIEEEEETQGKKVRHRMCAACDTSIHPNIEHTTGYDYLSNNSQNEQIEDRCGGVASVQLPFAATFVRASPHPANRKTNNAEQSRVEQSKAERQLTKRNKAEQRKDGDQSVSSQQSSQISTRSPFDASVCVCVGL